ncbi:hypothetical protein [Streptomyces pactum]|uniref:Uncharacterized protein n=1 Tax=Streptomyces pactum TaxID=68249 RepID=A0A1S6J902_9ACTN|nr:hypothetical protein [Streptomyces pactum]AQS68205.1 hypothetical protein B1H29_15810 [Streptomyces pactum]
MTETRDSGGTSRTVAWLQYGVAGVKIVFLLSVFRLLATPFSEEMFGEQWLPMPTWEWALASVTPVLLIVLARRPADRAALSGEQTILRIALTFYLVYGLAFAAVQDKVILWLSVVAGIGGLVTMYLLNRKEPLHGS